MTETPLLSVRGLAKYYQSRRSTLKILENISFDIARGEVVGLVGNLVAARQRSVARSCA